MCSLRGTRAEEGATATESETAEGAGIAIVATGVRTAGTAGGMVVAGTVTSIGTGIAGEAAARAITRTGGEGRSRRVVSTTGRAMQARTVVALAPRTRHVGGGRGHRTSVADQGRPGAMAGRPGAMAGRPGAMAGRPGAAAGRPGAMAGRPGAMAGRPGAAAGRRTVAGKVADRGRRNATVVAAAEAIEVEESLPCSRTVSDAEEVQGLA